jgi:hypothetical protein
MSTLGDYSNDFRAMEKASPNEHEDLQPLEFLDDVAGTAEDRLFAANNMLQMYDNISCNPDRARVKLVLKKTLDYYSWQFENEAGRVAGALTFAKVPATAQTGLRMKDDLRATKEKLQAIAASLD